MTLHGVVGIDLGTTYSAVAVYDADELDAVLLKDPDLKDHEVGTPSVVWDQPGDGPVVVGAAAKSAIPRDPGNVRIEVKREMGAESAQEPVHIDFHGRPRLPQELSALVLMKMKEVAELRLGRPVHDAVITVPAYFTERQKKATEEAALLAGLYPRQLVPEPTAAAICFGFDQADAGRHVYLVYDLGGGTFDVSIIVVEQESIEVLATSGNARLGGGNFDDAIVAWAIEQVGASPGDDPGWEQRLKAAAERAKQELATYEQVGLTVPARGDRPSVDLTLTRATFESLITGLLRGSLSSVEDALAMAEKKGVRREQLDAVLLVGGSTRIPLVKRLLLEHFGRSGDFVRSDANPDALVARGAAILANRFAASEDFDLGHRPDARQLNEDDEAPEITYITEHTLGVGVEGDRVDPLIPRGENIPRRATKTYTNQEDATEVHCSVYQGEGTYIYENVHVGDVTLKEIERRPAGYHRFEVTFALDINGLLEVLVKHQQTGREYPGTFERSTQIGQSSRLSRTREELLALYASASRGEPPATTLPPPLFDE